jgi:hypothetical protein
MKRRLSFLLFPLVGTACAGIHFSPFIASFSLGLTLLLSLFFIKDSLIKRNWWIWLLPMLFVWQMAAQLLLGWQSGIDAKILLKLPLLFFPLLVTWSMNTDAQKHKLQVLTGMNLFQFWIAAASVLNYLTDFEFYNQMILESKPIPIFSQVYHIEFSMMLSVFALAGIFEKRIQGHFISQMLFWLSMANIALVFFISVRTGMLCVMSGAALKWLFDLRQNKSAVWFLPGMFILVVLAFLLVPALKNRLNNTIDDVKTIVQGGDVRDKSLGRRWVAWDAALRASVHAPLTGFGIKGVEDAINTGYEEQAYKIEKSERVMPHNQFLDLILQSGWATLILLILFFAGGLFYLTKMKSSAGLAVWAALITAAFFESYFERQAGILLFTCAWLMLFKPEKTE